MNYKLLEDVFIKKDQQGLYLYSLSNENLVVVATGQVSTAIELLKTGASDTDVVSLWGADEAVFQDIYGKLTASGLTVHSTQKNPPVSERTFEFRQGSIRFTTFDQILPSKNVEVYASYCATSSCSYCDNCSCSDC